VLFVVTFIRYTSVHRLGKWQNVLMTQQAVYKVTTRLWTWQEGSEKKA
jgi:hypothetical protein